MELEQPSAAPLLMVEVELGRVSGDVALRMGMTLDASEPLGNTPDGMSEGTFPEVIDRLESQDVECLPRTRPDVAGIVASIHFEVEKTCAVIIIARASDRIASLVETSPC
jgi:hypothetical protein